MSNNTGGNAFPVLIVDRPKELAHFNGMTLRDYFAAKAMQAMVPLSGVTPQAAASVAYTFAAAMLKEREK
jgi:hypothetical protein